MSQQHSPQHLREGGLQVKREGVVDRTIHGAGTSSSSRPKRVFTPFRNKTRQFAPIDWRNRPNDCLVVASQIARESEFYDHGLLFSALYRFMTRDMTLREAAYAYGVSISTLKSAIPSAHSAMALQGEMELRGDEFEVQPYRNKPEDDSRLSEVLASDRLMYAVILQMQPPKIASNPIEPPAKKKNMTTNHPLPVYSSLSHGVPIIQNGFATGASTKRVINANQRPVTKQQQSQQDPPHVRRKEQMLKHDRNRVNGGMNQPRGGAAAGRSAVGLDLPPSSTYSNQRDSARIKKDTVVKTEKGMEAGERDGSVKDEDGKIVGYIDPAPIKQEYDDDSRYEPDPSDDSMNVEIREGEEVEIYNDMPCTSRSADEDYADLDHIRAAERLTVQTGKELRDRREWLKKNSGSTDAKFCLESAMDAALRSARVKSEEAKKKNREAIRQVLVDSVQPSIAARNWNIDFSELVKVIDKTRILFKEKKGKEFEDCLSDPSLRSSNASRAAPKLKPGEEPLLPDDHDRILKIREAVNENIKEFKCPKPERVKLRNAMYAACTSSMTVALIATQFNVPSSTLRNNLEKLRENSKNLIPPVSKTVVTWNSLFGSLADTPATFLINQKCDQLTENDLLDIQTAIRETNARFNTTPEFREKITKALTAYFGGGESVFGVAYRYCLTIDSVQQHVVDVQHKLAIIRRERVMRGEAAGGIQKQPPQPLAPADLNEVQQLVEKMCAPLKPSLRELIVPATVRAVMGTHFIRESALADNLNKSSLHYYVTRARYQLGARCPLPKPKNLSNRGQQLKKKAEVPLRPGCVTIDGITVPEAVNVIRHQLDTGTLDFTQAKPFDGTREELKEKIDYVVSSFSSFKYQIEASLTAAIMDHAVDGQLSSYSAQKFNVQESILKVFTSIVRVFVDLERMKNVQRESLVKTEPVEKDNGES